jgi:hypothetical protein
MSNDHARGEQPRVDRVDIESNWRELSALIAANWPPPPRTEEEEREIDIVRQRWATLKEKYERGEIAFRSSNKSDADGA